MTDSEHIEVSFTSSLFCFDFKGRGKRTVWVVSPILVVLIVVPLWLLT